jgi:AcrR family transcriptional regulator
MPRSRARPAGQDGHHADLAFGGLETFTAIKPKKTVLTDLFGSRSVRCVTAVQGRQPKQARSAATRERLLDAAVECLVEYGYDGTSTTVICDRAGLSRGAQLHHFATKDELLLAALDHLARRRFEELSTQANALFSRPRAEGIVDRIREGVHLLWTTTFITDLFYGALELWIAGRSNPELRAEVRRVEHGLGKEVNALYRDLFPSEITSKPEGWTALRDVAYLLRGLALTRLLRESTAEEERILEVCVAMLADVAGRPPHA